MHPVLPFSTKIVMSALAGVLGSVAALGNGSILVLVARFKSLRTFPNILISNLAAVDLLNAAINMPIYTIYVIFDASWFRGKTVAIVTSSFDRLYTFLNLASMLALVVNVYFAIEFDFKYFAWKTNTKAVVCACLIWFTGTMMVVLSSMVLLDIDLGDAHVKKYRGEFYKRAKYFVAPFMAVLIILGGVVGFMTIRSIKKRKATRAKMNLSALQAEARLQSDIKAIKTIAITVAAYFISYVPVILYAVLGQRAENLEDSWFGFIAWYSMSFSSAVNPFIYHRRTSRFRSAFKQLINDPFGSSDFKEKPSSQDKGRRKENFDGAVVGTANQEKYRGERRNEIMVLSTAALQDQMCVLEVGRNSIDVGGNPRNRNNLSLISPALSCPLNASSFSPVIKCGEDCAENNRMMPMETMKKEPCQETEATTFDENEDATKVDWIGSNKSGLVNKSGRGKRPLTSTRWKVHPLVADSMESRYQAQKRGEVLAQCIGGKKIKEIIKERRNTVIPVISI